jgi:uncharacterized RDD family membrane protein YckC
MNEEKYHTLIRRFGAAVIDIWPLIPFFIATYIWVDLPIDHLGTMLINFGTSVVGTGYYVLMHARTGQTVGKRICGVRVVTVLHESQISWKQSFLRESPLVIFFVIFTFFDVAIFTAGAEQTPLAILTGYIIAERFVLFWSLADALCAVFNVKRRSLHDCIGQTVVVRT